MPQTREHVAILDLLGISNGVVALTKRDLVDDEWLDLVSADVEEFLAPTTLNGAPLVPCSATTGAGLDALVEVLQTCLARERTRRDTDRPRLPIDRVFTVAGFGTVVTGTLIDGELHLGQELEVQPGGLRTRVRGLQSHRKKLEAIPAGTRTAVNLGGLAVEDLRRGQVLAAPGTLKPTRAVDGRLRLIQDARPVRHNAEVTFHTGAAESPGKLSLLDRDELQPGEEAWVQVRLQDEVALARGDLFILRLPSPSMTVGGGSVIEPHARRHRRRQAAILRQLEVLARGSPEDIVLEQLRVREPADVNGVVQRTGLGPAETRAAIGRLVETSDVLLLESADGAARLDGRAFVISSLGWRRLTEQVETLLKDFHRGYPLRRGLPKEELRNAPGRRAAPLRARARAPRGAGRGGRRWTLRAPDRAPRAVFARARASDRAIAARLARGGRCAARSGRSRGRAATVDGADRCAADAGPVVEVAAGLLYERETLQKIVVGIRADIEQHGPRTVAQIRDLLDASRKFTLALVNYMDDHKITRRVGDERVLY